MKKTRFLNLCQGIKKLVLVFLIVALICTTMPQTAFAASTEDVSDFIREEIGCFSLSPTTRFARTDALRLEGSDSNIAEGWSWDADTRTLILNNATIISDEVYALRIPYGTIVLEGNNTIKSTCYNPSSSGWGYPTTAGIYCYNGNLTIEGSGSLTAVGGVAKGSSYGIYSNKGRITINGGTILTQGGECGVYGSHGIKASSSLTINGGFVTAEGGPATGTYASSYGASASSLIMTGGTLNARAGTVPDSRSEYLAGVSIGIHGDIDLSAGVTVTKPVGWMINKINGDYSAILDSYGRAAQEVIIQGGGTTVEEEGPVQKQEPAQEQEPVQGQTALRSPVISLTTDTTISEDEETTVIWSPINGAFRYYITILNKTTGIYDVRDHILDGSQTSYLIPAYFTKENDTYEIYVKSVDHNGNESEPSNVITLTIGGFITEITKTSLRNADAETKKSIQNALYNILFKAQFRPDTNEVDNTNFGVYGSAQSQKAINAKWEAKNGGGLKYQIHDAVLGTVNIGGGAGCNSYGRFVSKYTYGTVGTATGKISSESNLIDMIHRYADPGEWIRMDGSSPHVVVFLGESQDGKGFTYVDYSDQGGKTPQIRVGHYSYHDFWEKYKSNSVYIMDTNGGSYYEGTGRTLANVRSNNNATKIIVKLACPVEATISLGSEALDSRHPGAASFGNVVRDGDEVTFTIDYREDYQFSIVGTGEGAMTLTLNYYNGNQLLDERTFINVPISDASVIQTSGFDCGADFTLYIDNDGNGTEDTAWGAKVNEAVYAADKQYDTQEYETANGNINIKFSDVATNVYYYDAVQWAVANGVTSGYSDGTFQPNATCTRAQIVTFLWRANGSPEPSSTVNPFTDLSANAYYYKAVLWAVEQGITTGTTATTFSPDNGCTRAQAVTFLYRAEGSPATSSSNSFGDVSSGSYYSSAVAWAVSHNITNGTTATTFSPGNMCTRAQIVTFLWRDMTN